MLDAGALIAKHQGKPVLIDTNLLVLLFVGILNPRRISTFKRTENFSVEDFDLLQKLISGFSKIVSTPHVLAEVSNLTKLSGAELADIREVFSTAVEEIEESHDPSRELVSAPLFQRLGLTDSAIAAVCERGTLVLTTDVDLQVALQQRGADALNFNHVRALGWNG